MLSSVLNHDQILRIHRASISILDKVGVVVPHDETLDRLQQAGATVDWNAKRAYIPEELVSASLEQAGKQFTLYGRDLSKTARFGQGKRNYNSIAGEASWVDEPGGQRRFAAMSDVATAARFCDALDNINLVGAMADAHEVPVSWRCVETLATLIRNTTKPVHLWFNDKASTHYLLDVVVALRGTQDDAEKYPICHPFLEPISPLRFPHDGVDLLYEATKMGVPVSIGPMAQMGMSAPMSIAGTLAQENAEILSGVVITQLVRKGTAVCYGGICHAFDMRTTQMIFCGPEQAIFGVAMTQMGKHYGLPVYVNVGLTDSKRPDAQAGLESGVTLAFAAAAGADIFGHMGISGVDQGSSLDMLVLQNEIIGYVESTMRTIDLSDEALGLDVIEEVGPGGNFIDHGHTAERFRSELWFPRLLDREYYQQWLDSGATSTEDRCRDYRNGILESHQPEPISEELSKELDRIVAAARQAL